MDEDTIRIVTDDAPQILAPDGSKMGIEDLGPYYFQDDEASKQKGKEAEGVSVHNVKVKKLEEEMGHLMQVVERLFNRTQQQGNKKPGMQLDEIELSVEINAQQAFYLEHSQFATTVEELELGLKTETKNYKYEICIADNTKALATATAQENILKSYAGAVFVIRSADDSETTISTLCETIHPSRIPPEMPYLTGSDIECAPGSCDPRNS